jgi:hypothetical protein
MYGGQRVQAVGGVSGWCGLGLVQGGENGEETEGLLGRCSPWAERGGKVAGGGPRWRPMMVLGGGGALVAGSRREDAPRTRLGVAQLPVVAAPPIDAHPHRIAGWPAAEVDSGKLQVMRRMQGREAAS